MQTMDREPEAVTPERDALDEPAKKKDNVIHLRLPMEAIDGVDKIAEENNISRAAVIAIAVSRMLRTGL